MKRLPAFCTEEHLFSSSQTKLTKNKNLFKHLYMCYIKKEEIYESLLLERS